MRIEFWFRTYSSFGGSATLNVAGKWISQRVKESYGGNIESVLIELCCKNVSPPRITLENLNERFETYLSELPNYGIQEKGTELRISYRAVKWYHDEVDRDSQVLALKLFGTVLRKSVALIEQANEEVRGLGEFNGKRLAADISAALPEAPATLLELVKLYEKQQENKPNN